MPIQFEPFLILKHCTFHSRTTSWTFSCIVYFVTYKTFVFYTRFITLLSKEITKSAAAWKHQLDLIFLFQSNPAKFCFRDCVKYFAKCPEFLVVLAFNIDPRLRTIMPSSATRWRKSRTVKQCANGDLGGINGQNTFTSQAASPFAWPQNLQEDGNFR